MHNIKSPWLTHKTLEFVSEHLTKDMSVFEWGSGFSTLFLSGLAKEVISVEHNPAWYYAIHDELEKLRIKNVRLLFIPPLFTKDARQYKPENYTSKSRGCKGFNFRKYITHIENYPSNYFDLVLVDGRSRISAVYHAINKTKNGGYIILDNSDRKHYRLIHDMMSNFEVMDLSDEWGACAWKIKK